jgi:uncharacterized protein YndB with AHSA1/START domain
MEPFRFDRAWEFPLSPDEFWEAVARVDEFPRWWGWLRSFRSDGLVAGSRSDFIVQSALPYKLHFEVVLDRVEPPRSVEAIIGGDLAGPASLDIERAGEGCRARLAWELEPRDALLRTMASISRPLMAWSHDQVVRLGIAQFRRQLLAPSP